jgi:hypothetical protein
MAEFPKLKTGAVLQYPATRTLGYASQVLRFLDGTEQSYRTMGQPMRRWEIRLDLLDDRELAEVEAFFEENQGAFGSFAFTDPWDETAYTDCSLEADDLASVMTGEMRGRTSLVVKENRN